MAVGCIATILWVPGNVGTSPRMLDENGGIEKQMKAGGGASEAWTQGMVLTR